MADNNVLYTTGPDTFTVEKYTNAIAAALNGLGLPLQHTEDEADKIERDYSVRNNISHKWSKVRVTFEIIGEGSVDVRN